MLFTIYGYCYTNKKFAKFSLVLRNKPADTITLIIDKLGITFNTKSSNELQAQRFNFFRVGKKPIFLCILRHFRANRVGKRVGKQALGWDFPQSPHP